METIGYIPREDRKKILLICDDIRSHSGVGNVAKDIVTHTADVYNWVNVAGSIKHPEAGQRIDISPGINKDANLEDSSVICYPQNGYGNPQIIRQILEQEEPDGILFITDPRYFEWLFAMEREIRREIPMMYLNIWDDMPAPQYNEAFYEACDGLFGISKQTKLINETVLGEKANDKILTYIPHGIDDELFYIKSKEDKDYADYEKFTNGLKGDAEFTMLFNSRNMRRKQIPDAMAAFRIFLDGLPKAEADKCRFVLHTEVVSEHGTDLEAVREYLFGGKYDNAVRFSTNKLHTEAMHWLYNMADVLIQVSSNEGWGLALTEALMCGTPIIATVTGGMQDQMRFVDENGNWFTPTTDLPSNHTGRLREHGEWAFPVYPTSLSLQGSPRTPYIFDDRIDIREAAEAIRKAYDDRKNLSNRGKAGRDWITSEEAGFTAKVMSDRVINSIEDTFENFKPRGNYEVVNSLDFEPRRLKHPLIY